MDKNVTLRVNDQNIPMNGFVKNVFRHVTEGLVESLDKIPVPVKKIEIIIEKEDQI